MTDDQHSAAGSPASDDHEPGGGSIPEAGARATGLPPAREPSPEPRNPVRRAIEFFGEHPFATGLLALLGLVGFGMTVVDFRLSRADERATTDQLTQVESAVRELPTTEQVGRIEGAVVELGERLGATHRGGVFLFEEPVEGLYFNEWWAHPISSDRDIERYGQAEVTIRGEGKTIDFSGVMSMNCENGRFYWRSLQNFLTPIEAAEADVLVPDQIRRNVYRLFCRDR